MEFVESIAHIGCGCGQVFQALNETGDDWDEATTAASFKEHQKTCPLNK